MVPPRLSIARKRTVLLHRFVAEAMDREIGLPLGRWSEVHTDLVSVVCGVHVEDGVHFKSFEADGITIMEFRSFEEKPQVRIFGRFAKFDVFVGLGWRDRNGLGGYDSENWAIAGNECNERWNQLFTNSGLVGIPLDRCISSCRKRRD